MTQDMFTDEEMHRLLKKAQMPEPRRDLSFRIEAAVTGDKMHVLPYGAVLSSIQIHRTLMSCVAVLLALGVGVVSGVQGKNNGMDSVSEIENYVYYNAVGGISLTSLYFDQSEQ